MTFQQYQNCLKEISKVIKKKYTNMSTDDAIDMSGLILNAIIKELDLKQE